MGGVDAGRAVAGLQELRRLTGDEDGAQRVAWTDTWITAREWLRRELDGIEGVTVETDEAGNTWASAPGEHRALRDRRRPPRLRPERRLARRRAQRARRARGAARARARGPRRSALKLVDWADEEGARFGRSLLGSSACAGTLDPEAVRGLTDRDGCGAARRARRARRRRSSGWASRARACEGAAAYLELHIEQGPVLERMDLPLGVVLGTFGVQRHMVRFTGAHAHAGATPMDLRRDAFLAAARSALAWRDDAARRDDVRATAGVVKRLAGDRDRVQRHLRGVARPARARRGRARRDARDARRPTPSGSRRRRAARSRGSRSGRSSRSRSTPS